ncbi:DUF4468 domain-containing protein [Albibacterium profundi]|uniref:DUF4468 domain-containing protein n=1 Tax=Albibacterium profundi TaxID=3134906 RepID=A0ABV5CBH4_9SPHI
MQRSIFTLFLFTCLSYVYGQDIPINPEFEKVEYSGVVERTGTQEELYEELKAWVVQTFKSAEEVILTDDKQAGKLSLRGQSLISLDPDSPQDTVLIDVPVHFNLLFDIKENSYQYRITDIYFEHEGLVIPMEETLLTSTQQERIIRDRLFDSSYSEEEKVDMVAKGLDHYRQFKSKGRSTLKGIEWLIAEGLSE